MAAARDQRGLSGLNGEAPRGRRARVASSGLIPVGQAWKGAAAESPEENKQLVARFVEVCQNRHDLAAAGEFLDPEMINHHIPEGRAPAGFQRFYGMLLGAFPDATMTVEEQIAERDLVATRKTFRGTHLGELWGLPPTGNRVEWEFIDIFRVRDGRLAEHWTHMDFEALRAQMRPRRCT